MTASTPDPAGSVETTRRRRLSPEDWTEAALDAIGEVGLAGVAVEPLAARLGATKGSFYWHFRDQRALVEAALERWEQERTEAVIAEADGEPDPTGRMRRLFDLTLGIGRADRVELALLANVEDPVVAPVLRRVTDRRIGYVASLYEQLGLEPTDARGWASIAVSVHLGQVQLAHAAPEALPRDGEPWERHLARLGQALLPRSLS